MYYNTKKCKKQTKTGLIAFYDIQPEKQVPVSM